MGVSVHDTECAIMRLHGWYPDEKTFCSVSLGARLATYVSRSRSFYLEVTC